MKETAAREAAVVVDFRKFANLWAPVNYRYIGINCDKLRLLLAMVVNCQIDQTHSIALIARTNLIHVPDHLYYFHNNKSSFQGCLLT